MAQSFEHYLVEDMDYRLPELRDENDIKEYINECIQKGESSVIYDQEILQNDYPLWVEMMSRNAQKGNGEWGKSLLLFGFNQCRIVGIMCVRYDLSAMLQEQYGNIGYNVRPSERRKGYATKMLKQALVICKEKGLESVLIGCHSDNDASKTVIERSGGVFDYQKEENFYFKFELRY